MNFTKAHLSCVVALVTGIAAHPLQASELSLTAATQFAQATFRDYFELLALPNDAIVPADIRKNVEWLEAAFRKRGFTTQQLANDVKPMLFAELPGSFEAQDSPVLHAPGWPACHSGTVGAKESLGDGAHAQDSKWRLGRNGFGVVVQRPGRSRMAGVRRLMTRHRS